MSNLKIAEQPLAQLEEKALRFIELKAQIRFLAAELAPLHEELEAAAAAAPNGKIVTSRVQILLSLTQSETFDKKAAIAALGPQLTPFIGTKVGTQLRVT